MIGRLPKADWNRTDAIEMLVYDPPSKERKRNDAYTKVIGVYTIGDLMTWPAPIVVYQDMRYSSPLNVALSIVGNALLADRHRRLIRLRKEMQDMEAGRLPTDAKRLKANRAEVDRMLRLIHKDAPPDELVKDLCEGNIAIFNAHKVLHPDPKKLDAMARKLSQSKCR